MVKSRIEQLAEKPKFTEGEIVISTQGSITTVVLVTGVQPVAQHLFAGIKLFSERKNYGDALSIGSRCDHWVEALFVKFNGTVILEND